MGASKEDCRMSPANIVSNPIVSRPILLKQKKAHTGAHGDFTRTSLSLLIKHFWNFNMFSASQRPLYNETIFTKNSLYIRQFGIRERPAQIIFKN